MAQASARIAAHHRRAFAPVDRAHVPRQKPDVARARRHDFKGQIDPPVHPPTTASSAIPSRVKGSGALWRSHNVHSSPARLPTETG